MPSRRLSGRGTGVRRGARALVAVVLLAAVALVVARLALSQPVHLSDEEKLYGLSLLWQEVNYNFAFFDQVPDLDWDAAYREHIPRVLATDSLYEYYRELQHFMALLNDGHTGVRMPSAALREQRRADTYPWVQTERIDGHVFVERVGRTLRDTVPPYSEVVEIDGRPSLEVALDRQLPWVARSTEHRRLDAVVRAALRGPADEPVRLRVETPTGASRTVVLERDRWTRDDEWVPPTESDAPFEMEWLDDSIAYVALNTFNDAVVVDRFEAALPQLRRARALVLDVRRNHGGNSLNGYRVAAWLTDETLTTSAWKTREHRAAFKAWGAVGGRYAEYADMDAWYDGGNHPDVLPASGDRLIMPIAVLQDHDTISAAEDFLVAIDAIPHVTTVGRPSAGSTGQPLTVELPGGGQARIVTKRDTFPDGREFVGIGIMPDVRVEPTMESVRAGRDVVLERAVELLHAQLGG